MDNVQGVRDGVPPSLDDLGDNVLDCILFHLATSFADLSCLSRTSKRYHAAVFGADDAWKRAYELSFGMAPVSTLPSTANIASSSSVTTPSEPKSWFDRYKARYEECYLQWRPLVLARLSKAASSVQTLEQQVYRTSNAWRHERQELKRISRDLRTLQAAMQAEKVQEAHTYWVPTAVTRAQGSVVVQVPQNAVELELELKNKIAVGELECTKLGRMIAAKRLELMRAKICLQSLRA